MTIPGASSSDPTGTAAPTTHAVVDGSGQALGTDTTTLLLLDAERAARTRAEALQRLSTTLAPAREPAAVAAATLAGMVEALGAFGGGVFELAPGGDALVLLGVHGFGDEIRRRSDRIPLDTRLPLCEAVRRREPLFFESIAQWRAAGFDDPYTFDDGAWAVLPLLAGDRLLGAITVVWRHPRVFGSAEGAFHAAFANLCAQALDRSRAYDAEHDARSAAEAASRRVTALQTVTAALAGALTAADVADVVVRRALPALGATRGSVALVTADGRTLEVIGSAGYPDEVMEEFRRVPIDVAFPLSDVVRSGEALLLATAEARAARYPALDTLRAGNGGGAMAALPLRRGARVVGAIGVNWAESRDFEEEDRAFLTALAEQCAQALERASLFEAERSARATATAEAARVRVLHELTEALAGAVTPTDVAAVALERARPAFGAVAGMVNLLTENGLEFVQLRADGFGAAGVPWPRYPVDSGTAGAEVVRTGEPVFVRSFTECETRFPVLAPVCRQLGFPAFATLPLLSGGRVLGLVAFNFVAEREFVSSEREQMRAFAGQCALALARAQLIAAERAARAEAERANRVKMDFLATMSHELRTPLNAIAGHTQLLEMGIHGPVTPAQRVALARIQGSQAHLLGLINDVLNFAKLEAGKVELRLGDVPLGEAVTVAADLMAAQFAARGVTFAAAGGDGVTVRADAEKVRQVLLNLLSNAVKYTPAGGRVEMRGASAAGAASIEVCDTGIGIAPSRLDRVFEPFVQLGRSLSQVNEGTGLGLAISRDLARAMGGDLTAESTPGTGSTFRLTLPLA